MKCCISDIPISLLNCLFMTFQCCISVIEWNVVFLWKSTCLRSCSVITSSASGTNTSFVFEKIEDFSWDWLSFWECWPVWVRAQWSLMARAKCSPMLATAWRRQRGCWECTSFVRECHRKKNRKKKLSPVSSIHIFYRKLSIKLNFEKTYMWLICC